MELINILILVSAVVVVLVLWIAVGIRHIRRLREGVADQWEIVDEDLRMRHDLLPNLIDTIRDVTRENDGVLDELIELRAKASRINGAIGKKVTVEHELSDKINKVLGVSKAELKTDTNYLELRKEIEDYEQNLLDRTKQYNGMVREYNKRLKWLTLRPLAFVFRLKKANVFEVEV